MILYFILEMVNDTTSASKKEYIIIISFNRVKLGKAKKAIYLNK